MQLGAQLTLTASATNYNLMSMILTSLGYTVPVLTSPPNIMVKFDGSGKFFPKQVRSFTITNGLGTLTITDEQGGVLNTLAASGVWSFNPASASLFLDKIYLSTTSAGSTPNIAVETP